MKNKAKTFEFLTLFTMVIGTVVGSGIFMKNKQLLAETGNPIIAIILWIAVGLICVLTVYVFIQIASATRNFGNGTISIWTKLFINRKVASFCGLFYVLLYFPICQSVFVAGFVTYFFQLLGKPLTFSAQLTLFLVIGLCLIAVFAVLNAFSRKLSKGFQIFGTIFKFIPLFISLVAGFFLIDKTPGLDGGSAIWNGMGVGAPENGWLSSEFQLGLFFRGFGAILFAFDGFIYIANSQKTAKHKDVVPKALLFGMLFVALFYTLMAVSLFLGSPDGSIVKLLERIFSQNPKVAKIISNATLMMICLIGINTFAYIGTVDLESSVDAKLIFTGKNHSTLSYCQTGIIQGIACSIIYIIFILTGALVPRNGWTGVDAIPIDQTPSEWLSFSSDYITGFIGTMSSTASIFVFLIIAFIIIASFVNEYSKKVDIVAIKGFKPLAIICASLLIIFVVTGLITFIIPIQVYSKKVAWVNSDGLYFSILLVLSLVLLFIVFLVQERIFKKFPFANGFEGYLVSTTPLRILEPEKMAIHETPLRS